MRLAQTFVMGTGLFLISLLSAAGATVQDGGEHEQTHQAIDHSNHHPAVQREVPFEYRSQDPDIAYSLFMHHSSGVIMLLLGLFLLIDRLLMLGGDVLRVMIGCTWMLLGAFVFINSDLEGWPIGPAGFIESFNMPTTSEWVQHKVLSLIPMVMGAYAISARRILPTLVWNYAVAGIALLGGIALQVHQHADHPGFDVVNLQHRIFALTVLLIASGLIVEQRGTITWKSKPFLVPVGVMLLGIQLVLYVE
jgi:hypothetical protein